MNVQIEAVQLEWTSECNIIVGQSHFIKTVEDISEIVTGTIPRVEYGLAFCEASGPCLIRTNGNSPALIKDAVVCAEKVAAGHTFYLVMKNGYPINVLTQIKACPEVAQVFAATANPLQIITAGTEQGRGVIGVIDGFSPKGVEGEEEKKERHQLLRTIGYKF